MKKILLINPFGIGDALFSMTIAAAIKKANPMIQIHFMGNERTEQILRCSPAISDVQVFNRDEWRRLRERSPIDFVLRYAHLIGVWKKERYDAVLDYSLGREFGFLSWMAGIPMRAGFDYKKRALFMNRKLPFEGYEGGFVVDAQKKLALLLGLGLGDVSLPDIRVPEEDKRAVMDVYSEEGFFAEKGFFGVAPGGGRSWGPNAHYKQWSPERFAEAIRAQHEKTGSNVLLFGDESERPLLEQVRRMSVTPCYLVCGESLSRAAAFLGTCRYLLCNDGGLMHLAHSLSVPVVAIFGPVDEKTYGPFGEARNIVVTKPVPCRPCYRQFHFPSCAFKKQCLEDIPVTEALQAIEKLVLPV